MKVNFDENFLSLIINFSEGYKLVFEENFDKINFLIKENFKKNNYEIIIISNTSNEEDFSYLKNLVNRYENVRILFVEQMVNPEVAFTVGLESCIGDLMITLNMSLHPVEIIKKFLYLYKNDGFELIIGVQRDLLKSKNFFKTALYKFYYAVLSFYTGKKINYAVSTCRLFSRKIINHFINKKNLYQTFSYFTFYPGVKTKNYEFSNVDKYKNLNKKDFSEKFDKAINLLITTSSFPTKIINMVLNLGILINLIYIIYILGFTFRIGIGSGWSSISIQNATMFLMIFFVMRVFMAYYTRRNETENRSSLDKIINEISSFNLSKFKNITDYENKRD